MTPPELSIVIPVYNEGERVEPVLRALHAGVRTPHEILVVWDFDGDTTRSVVERLAAELPGLRGHRNDLGRGVLNAMRAGIAAARAPLILISMADGSDEPHVVDPMVALARDGAAVVAASRYMRGGRQVGGPRFKRLLSRVAGLSLHWFGGVATHDPTNNFKLYRRDFLDAVEIESEAGFELALELTVKATLLERRVAEVPTTWRDRTAGESRFRLRQWLPHYLRWYMTAFRGRIRRAIGAQSDNSFIRAAARIVPIVLLLFLGALAVVIAELRWSAVVRRDLVGTDLDFYRIVAQRFLDTGSQYLPYQLAGPYDSQPLVPNSLLPSLYPPPAVFLFVPFLILPALLWWAIPLSVVGFAIWRWRPARWTWLIVALCLAWPGTTTPIMVGNTTMWAVAAISGGLMLGWPAALLMLKPTFLPFAVVGLQRRSFWLFAAALVLVTLPFIGEWRTWFEVLGNGTATAGYSIGSYPAALIPVVCWLGRRRSRAGT